MEEIAAKDMEDSNNKPKGKEEKKEKGKKDKGKADEEVWAHNSVILLVEVISAYLIWIRIQNKHIFDCFKASLVNSLMGKAVHSVNQYNFVPNHRKRRQD